LCAQQCVHAVLLGMFWTVGGVRVPDSSLQARSAPAVRGDPVRQYRGNAARGVCNQVKVEPETRSTVIKTVPGRNSTSMTLTPIAEHAGEGWPARAWFLLRSTRPPPLTFVAPTSARALVRSSTCAKKSKNVGLRPRSRTTLSTVEPLKYHSSRYSDPAHRIAGPALVTDPSYGRKCTSRSVERSVTFALHSGPQRQYGPCSCPNDCPGSSLLHRARMRRQAWIDSRQGSLRSTWSEMTNGVSPLRRPSRMGTDRCGLVVTSQASRDCSAPLLYQFKDDELVLPPIDRETLGPPLGDGSTRRAGRSPLTSSLDPTASAPRTMENINRPCLSPPPSRPSGPVLVTSSRRESPLSLVGSSAFRLY